MFQVSGRTITLSFSSIESPGPFLQLNLNDHRFPASDALYQSTSNTEILNELARIINGADVGIEIYQPTQAVIVTWKTIVSMYQSF